MHADDLPDPNPDFLPLPDAAVEQQQDALEPLARLAGMFYRDCLDNGLPEDLATSLVASWFDGTLEMGRRFQCKKHGLPW